MPTTRIPLVGSITNRNANPASFSTADQLFVNAYPEVNKNPVTGQGSVCIYKRPGYEKGTALAGVSTATAAGAFVAWTGSANSTPPPVAAFVVGATSTSVWQLDSDTKLGGDIPTTNECTALTETTASGTPYLVGNFIDSTTTSTERWVFDEGGSWAQVTTNFPTNIVGAPAHLDGYVFDMTQDGYIVNSNVNTVTVYTSINRIQSQAYPDKGVTVARLGNRIMAFGEKSIESFINSDKPVGSPLQRVDTAIHMGAARRSASGLPTVLVAHGTIYWIATNSEGATIGIYRFNGMNPDKVSSPAIDKLLSSIGITGFVGTAVLHGMRHVLLKGTSGTWCYCLDTDFWWKLTLASGAINACLGVGILITPPHGRTYFIGTNNARGNFMGGGVNSINQDDGSNFTMTVRTQNIDFGTRRKKRWDAVSVIGDVQTSTSNIGISYSDNDYSTSSVARNIDMSVNGANRLTRFGASRRRAWQFENTANTPMRLEAVEFEYELGGP